MNASKFTIKIATEASEFEQIHALNYRTFVEEIPQQPPNGDGLLFDKFHDENTYVIGMDGVRVIAMMSVRSQRPFSLDLKMNSLDSMIPDCKRPCEVRLLSIEPEYRKTSLFYDLLHLLIEISRKENYDMILISGTVRQLKLYRHLGFRSFGPLVGEGEAKFQPMYLDLDSYKTLQSVMHKRSSE